MEPEWIAKQVAAKRKDDAIIDDLVKDGWDFVDASAALAATKKTPVLKQLTSNDFWFFWVAVGGIFVYLAMDIFSLLNIYKYSSFAGPMDDISKRFFLDSIRFIGHSLVLAAVLILFGWVLYYLSMKREHPKLHKAFFLYVAILIGIGVFFWIFSLFNTVLVSRMVTMDALNLVVAINLALSFSTSILFIEYSYNYLRNKYDNYPQRKIRNLVLVGIGLFIICMAILSRVQKNII
jgi:hypothetical protein